MNTQVLGGRYKVLQSMVSGGMAHTFLAVDMQRPEQPKCIVKQLKPGSDDPSFLSHARNLFEREAKILEQLGNHDQIPQLLAYFEEEGHFYLVMDYIEGHTLNEEMAPGHRWNETEVIILLRQTLEVLRDVHRQKVIHRDIKPNNLIRRRQDQKLVLIDFGAVREVKAHLTTYVSSPESLVVGTFGYMPTEQAKGNPRYESDFYSLGLVAIQALTGLLPTQLPQNPTTGEIVWTHFVPVNQDLASILSKMVRYHFKDRYHSVEEVLADLDALLGEEIEANNNIAATEILPPRHLLTTELETPLATTQSDSIPQNNPNSVSTIMNTPTLKKNRRPVAKAFKALASIAALGMTGIGLSQAFASAPQEAFGGDNVLTVGLLSTPNNAPDAYTPVINQLKQELKEKYGETVQLEFEALTIDEKATAVSDAVQQIKAKKWDLAFTTVSRVSAAAVENQYSFTAKMWPERASISTATFVRADSPIQSVDDINAQTKVALAGFDNGEFFYMPVYDLYGKTISVDLNNSLKGIMQKVGSGQADVGVGLPFLLAKNPNFRIIAESRQLPTAGVYTSPNLSQQEQNDLQSVLLSLPEDVQKSAQYSAGQPADYTEFLKIIQRVETVTGCRNWQQNPVPLYCNETAQSQNASTFKAGLSGQTNGIQKHGQSYHYFMKGDNGQDYTLLIAEEVFDKDPTLPAPFGISYKKVEIAENVPAISKNGEQVITISQAGQVRIF